MTDHDTYATNLTGRMLRGNLAAGRRFVANVRCGKYQLLELTPDQVAQLLERVDDDQETDAYAHYDPKVGQTTIYL